MTAMNKDGNGHDSVKLAMSDESVFHSFMLV